jgi:large subunit ribosomal protein L15
MSMTLHNLKPQHGAKHRTKRLGCGDRSGHGKTSCRGGKGQTARSGGTIRLAFEGGQMPLFRRLPKRGFNNAEFRTRYVTINLGDLNGFADGDVVSPESLQEKGLLGRLFEGVKILGGGDLTKKLTVKAQRFTGSAREKIVAAGGQCEDLPLLSIRNKLKPDVKTAKKTAQS